MIRGLFKELELLSGPSCHALIYVDALYIISCACEYQRGCNAIEPLSESILATDLMHMTGNQASIEKLQDFPCRGASIIDQALPIIEAQLVALWRRKVAPELEGY